MKSQLEILNPYAPTAKRSTPSLKSCAAGCTKIFREKISGTTADFAILGIAAKLERSRILERTARGRADAKANGVKFGRKPILTPHQQKEARARLDAGETQRSVARSYNVSAATISRLTA